MSIFAFNAITHYIFPPTSFKLDSKQEKTKIDELKTEIDSKNVEISELKNEIENLFQQLTNDDNIELRLKIKKQDRFPLTPYKLDDKQEKTEIEKLIDSKNVEILGLKNEIENLRQQLTNDDNVELRLKIKKQGFTSYHVNSKLLTLLPSYQPTKKWVWPFENSVSEKTMSIFLRCLEAEFHRKKMKELQKISETLVTETNFSGEFFEEFLSLCEVNQLPEDIVSQFLKTLIFPCVFSDPSGIYFMKLLDFYEVPLIMSSLESLLQKFTQLEQTDQYIQIFNKLCQYIQKNSSLNQQLRDFLNKALVCFFPSQFLSKNPNFSIQFCESWVELKHHNLNLGVKRQALLDDLSKANPSSPQAKMVKILLENKSNTLFDLLDLRKLGLTSFYSGIRRIEQIRHIETSKKEFLPKIISDFETALKHDQSYLSSILNALNIKGSQKEYPYLSVFDKSAILSKIYLYDETNLDVLLFLAKYDFHHELIYLKKILQLNPHDFKTTLQYVMRLKMNNNFKEAHQIIMSYKIPKNDFYKLMVRYYISADLSFRLHHFVQAVNDLEKAYEFFSKLAENKKTDENENELLEELRVLKNHSSFNLQNIGQALKIFENIGLGFFI